MSILALAALSIGMHVHSAHVPERDYQNNLNRGLYLRTAHMQAGAYRNTLDRTTVYAAYLYPVGPVELMAGIASGYQAKCEQFATYRTCAGHSRGALSPMAGVSYLAPVEVLGVRPRIFLAPGFQKSSTVIHLSLEKAL